MELIDEGFKMSEQPEKTEDNSSDTNEIKITKGHLFKWRLYQEDCYIEFDDITVCVVSNTFGLIIKGLNIGGMSIPVAKFKRGHSSRFLRKFEDIKNESETSDE